METVKRGAGRPAAAARKAKHDQRNPQPSRHTADVIGEQVRERALADGATPQQAYGRMTVPELKARLATLSGGKAPRGVSRMGKGDLMNAILAAEKTEATREAVHGPQETASAPAVVAATETNGDPKGSAKADRLRRTYDDLEIRIARLREQEELDAIRPDLDGNQIMELLGIGPGREVGEAYRFLLELRLEHGPQSPEQARAALLDWWSTRS